MVAVDIGGSHITCYEVSDVPKGIIRGVSFKSDITIHRRSKDDIIDDWCWNIKNCIENVSHFDGYIAFAFPGPFNYQGGTVEAHPNGKFKPLENCNIRQEIKSRIPDAQKVHFQNDAACFGIGEYYYGTSESIDKALAITIGSGIGSAFVHDGNIINHGNLVPEGGEVYHLKYKDAKADDYFSTRWFVNKASDLGVKVKGVKELIEHGDQKITQVIFNEFTQNLIEFLSPLATTFKAQRLVVGGNITKAWDHFGIEFSDVFKTLGINVKRSQLGERAICLGAARSMHNTLHL